MGTTDTAVIPLTDIHEATYLAMHGVSPQLVLEGRRVVFEVEASQEALDLLKAFRTNQMIPVLDFTKALKRMRGRMLDARYGYGDGYGNARQAYR